MKKNRTSTFTVEVPVRFTFKAREGISSENLLRLAEKEAERHILNGNIDWENNQVSIIKEHKERTAADIAEENAFWARVLGEKI